MYNGMLLNDVQSIKHQRVTERERERERDLFIYYRAMANIEL